MGDINRFYRYVVLYQICEPVIDLFLFNSFNLILNSKILINKIFNY